MSSRNSIIILSMFIIFLGTVCISGCEDDPTLNEKVESMLISGQWKNPIVTADGIDQSDLYQGFILKFNSGTYSTSGGGPLWLESGTWIFKDESGKLLIMDGSREIQINEITETNLELVVQNNNTTFKTGRVSSVKGKNIFRLSK